MLQGMVPHRKRLGYFLAVACMLIAGCSEKKYKTYPVTGVVKFEDGSVAKAGRVEFYSREYDLTARATISADGTFVIGTETAHDGAVEGEHQVLIMQMVWPSQTGVTVHDHGAHIDESYASFRSSGLTFHVEAKRDNFAEFVVRKQKKRRR